VVSPANLQLNTYPGLQITGLIGRTYQIQASPTMTVWTSGDHGAAHFQSLSLDRSNPVSGNKFYRAVLLP